MTITHLIALSAVLFALVTLLCWWQGWFGGGGHDMGLGVVFSLTAYGVLWAAPSLIGLVIYLIWGVPQ